MSDELERMALFPLETVLFPGARTMLHVFEDRYRELVRACLDSDETFGVALLRAGEEAEPYMVGTVVRMVGVQQYDDGRMDVRVHGERRFRIRRLEEGGAFLIGHIEPVVEGEVEDTPRRDALVLKAREYVEAYIESFFSRYDMRIAQVQMPTDATELSFAIANFLQIENLEKQRLLETTDTLERISEMIPILERHILEARPPGFLRLGPEHYEDYVHRN